MENMILGIYCVLALLLTLLILIMLEIKDLKANDNLHLKYLLMIFECSSRTQRMLIEELLKRENKEE